MQQNFWTAINNLIAQSEITIENPKGTKHRRYDFVYPFDYGCLENTIAADGVEIDVCRGSISTRECDAIICTVDLIKKDSEIKLLIGCTEEEKETILNFFNIHDSMKGIMIRREY